MANVLMSVAEFLRRNMRYCTILSVPTVNNLQYIPMSLGYHMSLSVSFLPSICTQMVLCNKNWSQNLFTVVEQRMFFFCPPHLYIFFTVLQSHRPPFGSSGSVFVLTAQALAPVTAANLNLVIYR